MEEFLSFRKMITPLIIQIIFWVGVVVCVIAGIAEIIAGTKSFYGGGELVLMGILLIFIGPLLVRIWCELLILSFRINENLIEIKKNTEHRT